MATSSGVAQQESLAGLRPERADTGTRRMGPRALLFATTAFLGAALLFVVQPLVARLILPSYGGSATVWSTSSLFFQVLLLGAYGYAHWSTSRLGATWQPRAHLVVLLLPLVALPLAIPADVAPAADASPVLWLLRTLVLVIGLPFAVVATTGPLLQRWYSWGDHHRSEDPYFLFAASNLGSFGGLLAYPLLIEPQLTLADQRAWWSAGFVGFIVLTGTCALSVRGGARPEAVRQAPAGARPGRGKVLGWVCLAFLPSSLMLGVTSHISTDIAAIPLLWVVPLAIYLATFVLAFARTSRVPPRRVTQLAVGAAIAVGGASVLGGMSVPVSIAANLVLLALVAYAAHARLAAERPSTDHLTGYYLVVSTGGALGGLLNGLIAPMVFDRVLEYWLALAVVPLLLLGLGTARLPVMMTGILVVFFGFVAFGQSQGVLSQSRTFFGSYSVVHDGAVNELVHGTTLHGTQFRDRERRRIPTTYYSRSGPLGDVFTAREGGNVAVVGLGAGTVAAYGEAGQRFTFYEIDPEIVRIARDPRLFSYLDDSAAEIETVVGDGRLGLAEAPRGSFETIILDAFSSDSIPVHLLTEEAITTYVDRLAPGGVLVVHISNRVFDLEPVLVSAADRLGLSAAVGSRVDGTGGDVGSVWVALGSERADIVPLLARPGWREPGTRATRWTDDYSSILSVLR